MSATKTSPASRTIARLKEAVADMNYAQRRLFELRTTSPDQAPDHSRDRKIDDE